MDAAGLEHLCKTLITAVGEARAMVRYGDNSADYADVVKHAHDTHDLLLEALLGDAALATPHVRGIAQAAANALDQIDAHAAACRNVNMDAAELSRLASKLRAAVTEAERLVREHPANYMVKLREHVRDARGMHDGLLEALLQHPTLSTLTVRQVAETSGSAIDQLESLATPRGEKH